MAEVINLATFSLDTASLVKSLDALQNTYFDLRKAQQAEIEKGKEVQRQINLLAKENKLYANSASDKSAKIAENNIKMQDLAKTQKDLFKSEQALATQMGTVKKELNQTTTQLRAYQDAEGKTKSLIDLGNDALTKQIKSKNDARAANIALNNVANQLNPNIKEEADLLVKLNKKMDENTKFIKENSSETAKQKMNIGNYGDAVKGISPQLDAMISKLQQVYTTLLAKKEMLLATTTATTGTSKALKIFRLALISTGIGAIVVLLGSLVTYLSTTQAGIDAVTSVTRPLQAIFQSMLGVVQNLGEKMFKAFSEPKKLMTELTDFIKNNLVNRFKAFAVILDGIANRDFKKITNGALQLATGVENVIDKTKKAGQETSKFFAEAAAKGKQIDQLQKDIEKSTLKYNEAQIKVKDELDEQLKISKDTGRSFAEREKASREIIKITKENGNEEAKIIQKQIEKLTLEQSLNDTKRTGNQEMIDLQVKLDAAKDRGIQSEIEQLRVIGGAKKEAAAQSKELNDKAIDDALAQSKAEIDLFVAEQGFKRKSTQEQYDFNNALLKKETDDLKLQLKNKKISQIEYDTQLLDLKNQTLSANADLVVENANLEIDAQIAKNALILANDQYLSDEQLKIKQETLAANLLAETNYQTLLLENGKINQSEYNAAINQLNEDNRLANLELVAVNKAAEQEKALIDLENQKIIQEENFIAQAEIDKAQNAIKLEQELANAEKTGADTALIKQKYAEYDKQIEEQKNANKLNLASQTFGNLAAIFGEESKAGKAMAIAQTTIDTYQSAVSAFKAMSGIPIVGPALGAIAAATAVASGFASVKKITATKQPTFKKPAFASGVIGLRGAGSGTSDDVNANLSAGESVINAKSTAMYASELSSINKAGGGVGLNGASNILNQNEIKNNANNSQMAAMIAEAVAIGAEAGTSKGSAKGITGLSDNRKIMNDAKF